MCHQRRGLPVRAALLALLLLALPLSGCAVEPPLVQRGRLPGEPLLDGAAPGRQGNNTTAAFEAAAPLEVRQWWRYRLPAFEDTRVVVADVGSNYIVGTANDQVAYFEASFDISNIGRIRKADLAGEQQGTLVEYYRFPLVANATWSTAWDDVTRTVRVLGPTTASVGGRTFAAMGLEAREGDRVAVRYDYVPEVGWFSRLDFINADGSTFGLALTAFGRQYNGTVSEARITTLYEDAASGPLTPAGQFDVPQGTTWVDVQGLLTGDAAAYDLGFRDPAGQTYRLQVGPCTANCTLPFNLTLPGVPGTWGFLAAGAVQGAMRSPSASLSISAVQVTRRALG